MITVDCSFQTPTFENVKTIAFEGLTINDCVQKYNKFKMANPLNTKQSINIAFDGKNVILLIDYLMTSNL